MRATRRSQGGVTVQDVARAAGVSAMTVSRVMNGGNNVRDETRDAVMKAVEQLQYRPNPAARTLAAGAPTTIGLLYSNPSAGYLSQFLIGALAATRRAGRHLVLEPCEGESATALADITRRFVGAEVPGVILPPPLSESAAVRAELEAARIPYVAIAMGGEAASRLNVRIDDRAAAAAVTHHLIEQGHRRIGFIHGHPNQHVSGERYRGFLDAIVRAGLDPDLMPVEQGYFTYHSGLVAAERLLTPDRRPTAVFASNDDMAAATIGVAHRMGLHIPDDLSVAGFDDTPIATSIWPELTTVRQPIAQMAETAVAMLLARLRTRGDDDGLSEQVLKHELIVRGSTAMRRT